MKITLCFIATMFCLAAIPTHAQQVPVTGRENATYAGVDAVVIDHLNHIECQAATIAISRSGRTLYSRGYGWSDKEKSTPTDPATQMRIASVTKPFTKALIYLAIDNKKLSLNTRAFEFLGVQADDPRIKDKRISDITVAQLLSHKGGWDRETTFEPMALPDKIHKELGLDHAVTPDDIITYMLGQPLQFTPGKERAYSNFGYCILGRILEKASGKSYSKLLEGFAKGTLKTKDIYSGVSDLKKRRPSEVWHPPMADKLPMNIRDASGGAVASAPALCKFLSAYWISGQPRKRGKKQSGIFFGSLPGTTSLVIQRSKDNLDVAILFNGRRPGNRYAADNKLLLKEIQSALDKVSK